jgi:hypothetical protein
MRAQYGLSQTRLVKLARMATGVDCLLVKQCLRLAVLMLQKFLNVQWRIRTDRSRSGNFP